ncbi:MAG TPA: hypothetical protein VNM87_01470, partial [Candidatus Udaeobacter sp.]|nr:hypothetical protein [Candidatus Udaeobacter sp.]
MSVSRGLRARAVGAVAEEERALHPAETGSRRRLGPLGLAFLLVVAGCGLSEDLPQNPLNVVAEPVSLRVQLPNGDTIERRLLVDGDATDAEWATVPYQFIAMGPENGNGGGSFIASLKVAHDSARVYVMVQWPDDFPDNLGPRLV